MNKKEAYHHISSKLNKFQAVNLKNPQNPRTLVQEFEGFKLIHLQAHFYAVKNNFKTLF